jgi:hypothetical protein
MQSYVEGGTSFHPLVSKRFSHLNRIVAQYQFEYFLFKAEDFRHQIEKYIQIMLPYPRRKRHKMGLQQSLSLVQLSRTPDSAFGILLAHK